MSVLMTQHPLITDLPCHVVDPEIFFAEGPGEIEYAKGLCAGCPIRSECLDGAVTRREACGVWGGELIVNGTIVARKRPRGRPRKQPLPIVATPPARMQNPVRQVGRAPNASAA